MNMKTKHVIISTSLSVALLTLNGCADKKLEDKEITVSEFKLLDKKFFNNHGDPKMLTVSGNGKNVYLTVNGDKELFHGDVDKLNEETGWTKVKLSTGLDDTPGKAKLLKATKVLHISPAKEGAMVSVDGTELAAPQLGRKEDNGVFYIKGASDYQAAWSSRTADLEVAAAAPAVAADRIVENGRIYGSIISGQNGAEMPYIAGVDVAAAQAAITAAPPTFNHTYSAGFIAMTKGDLTPAKLTLLTKRAATPLTPASKLVSDGKNYLFVVDNQGVNAIKIDQVGKAHNAADILPAAVGAVDGKIGSDSFKFDAAATAPVNNDVRAVIVSDDKLFIGFGGRGNMQGGVAVYDIKATGTAPTVQRPDIKWNGIAVKSLIKDDKGVVWAVTANNILEAKVDGKKGDSFIDGKEASDKNFENAKDGFKKESFPTSDIEAAVFVGDKLLIATDKGLMHIVETKKTLVGTKLVKAE